MVTVPKVILVPVDLEELATAGLRTAVSIARAAYAGIVVLHSSSVPKPAEIEAYARRNIPADVTWTLRLTTDSPSDAIVHAAEELSADLIIMGSRARADPARTTLGSVALDVERLTSHPVLRIGRMPEHSRPIHRILTGIDFSDASRSAYDEAKMLASLLNGSLTAVHVVRPGSATEDYTATAFDAWLPPVAATDPPIERLIVHGDPATLLVHIARAGSYDLIVLGGGGRITDWASRHAHVPVLAVKSTAVSEFVWEGPVPRMDDHLIRSSR